MLVRGELDALEPIRARQAWLRVVPSPGPINRCPRQQAGQASARAVLPRRDHTGFQVFILTPSALPGK